MIGKQILNYKIDSLLGKGGMGTVYLGKHLQMKRKVAVKMLHPDLSSNEDLRERFRNEAAALAHLQNPYIVTLYDYYESEEGLFLIMEYIEGMELADHINKVSGPIDEKSAIHYYTQVLDGFKYAHKKKVVHRDIKPSNILIDKDNDIKIMDFGIAKIVDSEKSLTKTGTQIGTVFYMSPEQVKGENIDRRSDIYSLGVTLFQMITGQCPYSNDTTEFQIYNNIVNDPLPDPASIYPGASKHLAQVIAKATQKNVEDRFQSCEEFKKALNDTAFKTVIQEPTVTENTKTQVKEFTPTNTTKKKKNTSIIIVITLIMIFGGGYFFLKENILNGEDVMSKPIAGVLPEKSESEVTESNWYNPELDQLNYIGCWRGPFGDKIINFCITARDFKLISGFSELGGNHVTFEGEITLKNSNINIHLAEPNNSKDDEWNGIFDININYDNYAIHGDLKGTWVSYNNKLTRNFTLSLAPNSQGTHTTSSGHNLIDTWLVLKVEKSYFHDYPDYSYRNNSYIIKGQKVYCLAVKGDFVKVDFTHKGKNTSGWMLKNDFHI